MYNNANVLFKASFVDGVSKVDRIQLRERGAQRKKKIGGGKKDAIEAEESEWERVCYWVIYKLL